MKQFVIYDTYYKRYWTGIPWTVRGMELHWGSIWRAHRYNSMKNAKAALGRMSWQRGRDCEIQEIEWELL